MDKQDEFKKAANELRIQPSDRVWDRLEERLDQDKGKVSMQSIYRWAAVAAALVGGILVVPQLLPIKTDTASVVLLVDLTESSPKASYAVYEHASVINALYDQHNWRDLNEGSKNQRTTRKIQLPIISDESGRGDSIF